VPTGPLASVVIPTYNRAHVIGEAIDSVAAQTYRDFEIIVVDDGSSDGIAARLAACTSPITLIKREANGGVSAARNDGIRHSRGDLVCFLDSDDVYLPRRLETAVEYLAAHPRDGAVYTDMLVEFAPGEPRTSWVKSPGAVPSGRIFDRLLQTDAYRLACMPTITVRRTVLEAVGGFDESLSFGEDTELWWRIARATCIGYIAEPTCVARPSPREEPAGSRASADRVAATHKVLTAYEGLTPRERRLALLLHCSNLRRHGIRLASDGRRAEALHAWRTGFAMALRGGLFVSAAKTIAACALGARARLLVDPAARVRSRPRH
jgi:Glycosyl transferase family 2